MLTSAILLAAGQSTRFGSQKLLARSPISHHLPIGLLSGRHLLAAAGQVIVVTRPGDHATQALFAEPGFTVIVADYAEAGMSHSLVAGVASAPTGQHLLIALADMPDIAPSIHRQVIAAMTELDAGEVEAATRPLIIRTQFGGLSGHPVLFHASLRAELLAIGQTKGAADLGARSVLQQHRERVLHLAVEHPGVLRDIDTPQALAQWATES